MRWRIWCAAVLFVGIVTSAGVQPALALNAEDQQRQQKVQQLLQEAQVEWEKPIPNETTQNPTNPKAVTLSKTVAAANEARRIDDLKTRVKLLLEVAGRQTCYTSIFGYVGKSQFIDVAFQTLASVPGPIRQIDDPVSRASLYQQLSDAWRALGRGALHGTHSTNKNACERERQKYAELAEKERKAASRILSGRKTLANSGLTYEIPGGFSPFSGLQDNPLMLSGPDRTLLLLYHGVGPVELPLFADEFMNNIGPAMGVSDLAVFEDRNVQIDADTPGLMRVATGTIKSTPGIFAFLMFANSESHYVISYIAPATAYEANFASFQALLNSVRIQ